VSSCDVVVVVVVVVVVYVYVYVQTVSPHTHTHTHKPSRARSAPHRPGPTWGSSLNVCTYSETPGISYVHGSL
jgi:hypothetical protein